MKHYKVALMGNPNVGKSTIFNKLTGKKQHTGNWAGKTVDTAKGTYKTKTATYEIIDLPGIYSLDFSSPEEEIAKNYLLNGDYDTLLIICDATDLYKNLRLTLEVLSVCKKAVLCINMLDEAKRKGICIDTNSLIAILKIPVICCTAKSNVIPIKTLLHDIENIPPCQKEFSSREDIIKKAVTYKKTNTDLKDKKIDKILCGKYTRFPIMILFLALILWITISGANYPSEILASVLFFLGEKLEFLLNVIKLPTLLTRLIIDGAYNVLAQVVSVMLPPMAIFFPLFSLLEQSGFLPRIAHNLDKPFKKCGSSGKQALTMCMGLGCNAVGVTSSRIIPCEKERLIAIITNNFMPCNGRFPTIILLISIFLGGKTSSFVSAVILTLIIVLSVLITFLISFILSKNLKGENSTLTIELPPYRRPDILKTLIDSFINKTLHILARAIVVAAPAGAIIWLISNIQVNSIPLLNHFANFLQPIGNILSMDGVILLAFILGCPANEIVLPITVMIYLSSFKMNIVSSQEMQTVFLQNGWNIFTALSVILFSVFHWPCTTTLLTVKKETKSLYYTFLAFIIPTLIGILLCLILNIIKIIFTG